MKLRNLLALALGLLLALTPLSAALAEGEDTTEPVTIDIEEWTPEEQRTRERDVGDITVTGDCGLPAVLVSVHAEGQGTIRAEDITVETTEWDDAIGARVNATAPKAQATVKAGEIAATAGEYGFAYGAQIKAADDGTVAVIAEAVTATATESEAWGVSATATDGGVATVQVTGQGGVQIECRDIGFGVDLTARGTDAVIQAQVAGDIAVQSPSYTKGAYVTAYTGGETELVCGGSVIAEGDDAIGLDVGAMEGGAQATVTVAGDVVAAGTGAIGLNVYAFDTGAAEVLVEGTISGATAVRVWGAGTEEAATLTVWALEGEITGTRGGDAEAFAQKIQYILKADPIEGGDVALDGATKYKDFDVATADTTVTVRPTLAEGRALLGVSNNGAALEQDEAGNYFLVVPQKGGVYLTYFVESRHGDWPLPLPVRCLGKVKAGDALLKFYDCGTFEIIVNGRGTVGYYGFQDGHLSLRCVEPVSLTENADGSVTLTLGDLSFPVDAPVIENLK